MQQFETEFTPALDAIADDSESVAPDSLIDIVTRSQARRRRHRFYALGLGLAGAAATVAALNANGVLGGSGDATAISAAHGPRPGGDSHVLRIEPGEPCPLAKRHPLDELAAMSESPIWMPDSASDSQDTLTGAWTCLVGDTPVLTFGDIRISYETGWTGIDVEEKWSGMIDQYGVGEVRTVLGRPAFVVPMSKAVTNPEVLVAVGDTLIRLHGTADVPIEELIEAANSIDLDRAVAEK